MEKLESGLGELLRHLTELVDRGAEQAYRGKGFKYRPRYTPIMRILGKGACSVSDITMRLSITQGAVSQSVKLMMEDGLVTNSAGLDGRQSIISLTSRGQKLYIKLKLHWENTFNAIQNLESEIKTPLRLNLSKAIMALEQYSFFERISKYEDLHKSNPLRAKTSTIQQAQGHFKNDGEGYALYRPSYPEELAQFLTSICPSSGLAIDVGCGTGQLSLLLADYFDQVIATDESEEQITHATPHKNIDYRCEAAESISAKNGSADLIVAAQAAHWFDLKNFYIEARRIAKPGAVLALVSYGVPYLEDTINTTFQKFYWQKLLSFWPDERHHVETGYTDIPFPFESLKPPSFYIKRDWNYEDFIGYINTWSASHRAKVDGHGDILNQFAEELLVLWEEPNNIKRITWPISIRLGRL